MRPTGQAIYLWRTHRRLTQAELALRCGVSRPNLSAIEHGGRDLTVQTLRRIAAALGTNPGRLADGMAPPSRPGPARLGRFALDRVARLASGERLKAPPAEIRLAMRLASILKFKTGSPSVQRRCLRGIRAGNAELLTLKAELAPNVLDQLIRRVETNLASGRIEHE
jgi:transcriptional regulator with XRE-family HTH domain